MCDENDSCAVTELPIFPVRRFARRPAGLRFSLRTLLLGMVVICAVLAMLVPLIRYAIDGKKWMRCHSNLAQIGLALHNYHDVYGSFPPAYLTDKAGAPLLSWRVLILPFLEHGDLYSQIKLDEPWNSPHNIRLAPLMPDVYRCPADANAKDGETSYVAVTGPETLWPGAQSRRLSDTRATVETILLVEAADLGISWMEPRDMPFDAAADVARGTKPGIAFRHPCGGGEEPIQGIFQGHRPNVFGHRLYGANCLFADGVPHAVSEDIAPTTMRELLTVRHSGLIGTDGDSGSEVSR